MKDKSYTNVRDMIRDLTDDDELIGAVDDALDRQKLIRQLMAMRAARGLSQADIANELGCTQSRISKMESAADDEIRYGDLRRYAMAVGCELRSYPRPEDMEPAEEVKCLASAVQDRLSRMAELAKEDEAIGQGVARFFFEVFVNFSTIVANAASSLPKGKHGQPRLLFQVGVVDAPKPDTGRKATKPRSDRRGRHVDSSV